MTPNATIATTEKLPGFAAVKARHGQLTELTADKNRKVRMQLHRRPHHGVRVPFVETTRFSIVTLRGGFII